MWEIRNAVIESATIKNDEDCLVVTLQLDYGKTGQQFRSNAGYLPPSYRNHKILSGTGHLIWRIMEIAGVTQWNDLKGKAIRVKMTDEAIDSIGHIVNDDWFCPGMDFSEHRTE